MASEMKGKVVLITGANAGIGKHTTLELARRGATVVASARNRPRGQQAVEEIRRKSGSTRVDLLVADLSSMAEVLRLAQKFLESYDRLDVLINNAGLVLSRRTETVDRFEMTFAVNHLAPFVLTNQLLDCLKASAPSRVVTVASRAHIRARLDFDDLHSQKGYWGMQVYSKSKLANILFTRELARRLEGSGVTANCLHPGVVRTRFGADGDTGGLFAVGLALMRPFFLSPQKGAETSVYLACSQEVEGESGKYFERCREARTSRAAEDMGAAARLWELSAGMTGVGR